MLDGHPQSYVEPRRPRSSWSSSTSSTSAAVLDALPDGPVAVTHVGGAGADPARYVQHTRPGSPQIVLEPDAALTEAVRRELPLPRGHRIRVRPVDGRSGVRRAARRAVPTSSCVDAYAAGPGACRPHRAPSGSPTWRRVLRPGRAAADQHRRRAVPSATCAGCYAGAVAAPAAHRRHRQVEVWKRRRFGNNVRPRLAPALADGALTRRVALPRSRARCATARPRPGARLSASPSPTRTPAPPRAPAAGGLAAALSPARLRPGCAAPGAPAAGWRAMPALTLPAPRIADPWRRRRLRWGILAPGGIAHSFARALRARAPARRSSRWRRAAPSGRRTSPTSSGSSAAHGSYEELVADPEVDAVYVASPHSEHRDHALLALEAGKPVLVEKAFTRNAAEAREVLEAASAAGVFAMEAMWTRLPAAQRRRAPVRRGAASSARCTRSRRPRPALYPDGPDRLADPRSRAARCSTWGLPGVVRLDLVLGAFATSLRSAPSPTRASTRRLDDHRHRRRRRPGRARRTMVTRPRRRPRSAAPRRGSSSPATSTARSACVRLVARDGTGPRRATSPRDASTGFSYEAAEVARCLDAGDARVTADAARGDAAGHGGDGRGARARSGSLPGE